MSTPTQGNFDFSSEKRELLQRLLKQEGLKVSNPTKTAPDRHAFPLSFTQQRMWFLHQLEPASSNYHMHNAMRLQGKLDRAVLEKSIHEIVQRHAVLRTTFPLVNGSPVQQISQALHVALLTTDLCLLPREAREESIIQAIYADKKRPFDLVHGPLFRAYLLRLDEEEHVLLLSTHHILADAWSMGILNQELFTLYNAFLANQPAPLPPLSVQYTDFALWQREWLQGQELEQQLNYWKQRLAGAPFLLSLPTDRPRLAKQSYAGRTYNFTLSPKLSQRLNAFCQREGVTLVILMLTAFQVLLARYSGQEDISVGMPVVNRSRVEFEPLIGNFVNTIVLRTDMSGNPTFQELLKRVWTHASGAYSYQDAPFEQVVEALHPERELSQTVLFQVLFSLQNAYKEQQLTGLQCLPIDVKEPSSQPT